MNSKAIDISDFFIEKGVSHLKLHNQSGLDWWLRCFVVGFFYCCIAFVWNEGGREKRF